MAGRVVCVLGAVPGQGRVTWSVHSLEILQRLRHVAGERWEQGISLSKTWDLRFKPFLDSCDFMSHNLGVNEARMQLFQVLYFVMTGCCAPPFTDAFWSLWC